MQIVGWFYIAVQKTDSQKYVFFRSELNSKLQDTLEQIEVWLSTLSLILLFESDISEETFTSE